MSSLRHNNTAYQLKSVEEIHDNTCIVPLDVRRCSNRWQRLRLKGMPTHAWAVGLLRECQCQANHNVVTAGSVTPSAVSQLAVSANRRSIKCRDLDPLAGQLNRPRYYIQIWLRRRPANIELFAEGGRKIRLEVFREYERLPRGPARGYMVQLSSSFMERIGINEDSVATFGQEYFHSYDSAVRGVSKRLFHPAIPVNTQYNFSFAFNTPGPTSTFTASNRFMYFAPQDSDFPLEPMNLTLPANPPFMPVPLSRLLLEIPTARQVLQDIYDQLLDPELAILKPVVELLVC
jgi:hypothetical protein